MKKHSFAWILFFILVAEAAGFIGTFFMGSLDGWYVALQKPVLNPPSWVFGPVWTTLYALMGFAAYLVWRMDGWGTTLRLYFLQLAVNALWTPFFFGLQNPLVALIDIVVLLMLVGVTIIKFKKVNHVAALLLVPYLLWVTFATYLNLSIVLLN